MEVVIRPFRADDWDGLFLLDRSCFEPPYRLEVPRLRALVQDPASAVVVIEARDGEESAIVGSLIVKHDDPSARLVLIGIMVDEGFRRVGLGRRLAGWAERLARARSFGELLAPLEAVNAEGGAFLEAVGFSREPGAPPFFDDPAGGHLWRRVLAAAEEPKAAPAPAESSAPESSAPAASVAPAPPGAQGAVAPAESSAPSGAPRRTAAGAERAAARPRKRRRGARGRGLARRR
jgi:ribosomal protein S18 acetylase RimI-like enzyme